MDWLGPAWLWIFGLIAGGVGGSLITAHEMRQSARIAELERRLSERRPGGDLPADVWSIVALLKLTSKDNLDALTRLSPEAALAVVRELMPQLFQDRVG